MFPKEILDLSLNLIAVPLMHLINISRGEYSIELVPNKGIDLILKYFKNT